MADAAADAGPPASGLSSDEARRRLAQYGPNQPAARARRSLFLEVLAPFISPLSLVLIAAAIVSAALDDPTGAGIIIAIVLAGSAINLAQTWRSSAAMRRLQETVAPTATVLRDGAWRELPRADVVPGDVIRLCAGDLGPVSSLFDFLTFWVLLALFQADETLFHTGWFVESLATQTLVLFVIRTAGELSAVARAGP